MGGYSIESAHPASILHSIAAMMNCSWMLTAKDLIFIRELLTDLGVVQSAPLVVYSDSKSAVDIPFPLRSRKQDTFFAPVLFCATWLQNRSSH